MNNLLSSTIEQLICSKVFIQKEHTVLESTPYIVTSNSRRDKKDGIANDKVSNFDIQLKSIRDNNTIYWDEYPSMIIVNQICIMKSSRPIGINNPTDNMTAHTAFSVVFTIHNHVKTRYFTFTLSCIPPTVLSLCLPPN